MAILVFQSNSFLVNFIERPNHDSRKVDLMDEAKFELCLNFPVFRFKFSERFFQSFNQWERGNQSANEKDRFSNIFADSDR